VAASSNGTNERDGGANGAAEVGLQRLKCRPAGRVMPWRRHAAAQGRESALARIFT